MITSRMVFSLPPSRQAVYVEMGGWTYYLDNTTNEQIMQCWQNDKSAGQIREED